MANRQYLVVRGAEFFAHHGNSDEKKLGQKFIVDIKIEYDMSEAIATDDPDKGFNYRWAYDIAKDVIMGCQVHLIQILASRIAERVVEIKPDCHVEVTIRKPGAPIGGVIEHVSTTVELDGSNWKHSGTSGKEAKQMNMTDLITKARIVELSNILYPGKEERRLEIRQKRVFAGEFMHDIDIVSHIGAHVETPNHFIPAVYEGRDAKDLCDFPPETWMGEAVFVDLSALEPGDMVTPEYLEQFNIRPGDIVLIGNAKQGDRGELVRMSKPAAHWLATKPANIVGVDTTFQMEETYDVLDEMRLHIECLIRDIPLIEQLSGLDQLKEQRFYFIGLPYRIKGCDAWPIRAIALEGVL